MNHWLNACSAPTLWKCGHRFLFFLNSCFSYYNTGRLILQCCFSYLASPPYCPPPWLSIPLTFGLLCACKKSTKLRAFQTGCGCCSASLEIIHLYVLPGTRTYWWYVLVSCSVLWQHLYLVYPFAETLTQHKDNEGEADFFCSPFPNIWEHWTNTGPFSSLL